MPQDRRLIATSRLVVQVAAIANWLFMFAVGAALLLSWPLHGLLSAILHQDPGIDLPSAVTGVRLLMLIGLVMAIATSRLLSALGSIVASARAGDPFVAVNARRLHIIGWSLLALQSLDVAAALLASFFPGMGSAAPSGDISLGGWMAVLMVFVLARVFAAGTAMRDELHAVV